MAEDNEQAIAAIVAAARRTRPATPRWLWILAGVIGLGCAVAFLVVMLRTGEAPSTSGLAVSSRPTGLGFGAGLAIGAAIGLAIGVAIARQLVRDHSSRSKP